MKELDSDAQEPELGADFEMSFYANDEGIILVLLTADGAPLGHVHLGAGFIKALGDAVARNAAKGIS
jgi:hypothetical protein